MSHLIEKEWTTMKRLVYICLVNGILWIWCSYVLAFLGREQIAENLSQVALTEIIGVIAVYAIKSIFENLSKHNSWPDKPAREPKAVPEVPEVSAVTAATDDVG